MKNICLYIIIGVIISLVSCKDDDYSTSPQDLLVFSADFISMDTVFCGIPAKAQSVWAFNNTKNNILISSVSQERGGQSGFRVNVDGVYVGPEIGYTLPDIEVRRGDSLRMFVEMTAPATQDSLMLHLEDNLLFCLSSGVQQRINLSADTWKARIVTDPVISRDTTITSLTPLVVYGSMKVEEGATLTLGAGTTLYFDDAASLDVHGRLLCLGDSSNLVTLRGRRLDRMFDYLPYDNISGQWKGVHFHPESYGNRMEFTDLHSAFDGIVAEESDTSHIKLQMISSTVHNCQGYCIKTVNSQIHLHNTQITNALHDCLYTDGGLVLLNGCTIGQFYPFDSNRGVALRFTADKHPMVFACYNTLVTGYADDEVMGNNTNDSVLFDYIFQNSILRTDEVKDTLRFRNVWYDKLLEMKGEDYFLQVDHSLQRYDFHLKSSPAVDAADPETSNPFDHDGMERDGKPDIGAYEFRGEKEE